MGGQTLGFPDFLAGLDHLPMAGGDTMDLGRDAAAAAEVAAADGEFGDLTARAAAIEAEAMGRPEWSASRQRACDRAFGRTCQMNLDASQTGGDAFLVKLDSKIAECGWPALGGDLALEAGGGPGLFLPAFARRFRRVVFLDASLVNIVLAARLCESSSIENVSFVRADLVAPPLVTGRFDMVHENGVIEHVHSPRRMLAEAVRLRSPDGYLICVSPNRFSIAPEPHFGLPLYGAIPAVARRALVPRLRGFEDGIGTDLFSLRRLRRDLAATLNGDRVTVFFLPRRLPFTARKTTIRRAVKHALDTPLIGATVDRALNEALLGIAPQHIVIAGSHG